MVAAPVRFNNLFRNCVPIPGMKHICDNLISDISGSLEHYDKFYDMLGNFDAVLSKPFYRKRFVETCLKGSLVDLNCASCV